MREVTDALGHHPSVALLSVMTYWMTQLIGHVNEVISMLTGIGALVLLYLTIYGKYNEVFNPKAKRTNKANPRDSDMDMDSGK